MSQTTTKNDTAKDPEKAIDLPPYGSRNPDPITDTPGSHPIETGIGAVLAGRRAAWRSAPCRAGRSHRWAP